MTDKNENNNEDKSKKAKLDNVLSAHSNQKENKQAKKSMVDKVIAERIEESTQKEEVKSPPVKKSPETIAERVDFSKGTETDASSRDDPKEPPAEAITEKDMPSKKPETQPPVSDEKAEVQKTTAEKVDAKEKPIITPGEEPPKMIKREKTVKHKKDTSPIKKIKSEPKMKDSYAPIGSKRRYWRTFFYDAGVAAKDLNRLLKHK